MRHKLSTLKQKIVNQLSKGNFQEGVSNDCSFIAMFHSIKDNDASTLGEYELRERDLRNFIVRQRKQGYNFVTLDELLNVTNGECSKKKCVVTFDDGYENMFSLVAPMLQELEVPFVMYVTTGFLNRPGYLSYEQVKELASNSYCTVGMHSHNHLMFRFEPTRVLREDFSKCRDKLRQLTGHDCMHYAFPYGSVYACSLRNCYTVWKMGVKSIAMTLPICLTKIAMKYPLYLPRIDIPSMTCDETVVPGEI